jgi:HEAT repeat protein
VLSVVGHVSGRRKLLHVLTGGDRRSTGRSAEVVAAVIENPALFADLFAGLSDDDRVVRMRAADALEKITREKPELLQPWKKQLLRDIAALGDKEMRWHVAQMIPRLALSPREERAVVRTLVGYLSDPSSIVRTCSMQALADLAEVYPRLRRQVDPLIEQLTTSGSPAMRSRGRKLLRRAALRQRRA